MSKLLWKRKDGMVLSTVHNGLELIVSPAGKGDGFRYQLIEHRPLRTMAQISVASGYRQQLVDAISAAETIANHWRERDGSAPSAGLAEAAKLVLLPTGSG